jgi:hypothetical protein
MAKNTNRAASAIAYVAALVLATGAWAAHWEMYVNNPVTYAKEIFGGESPAEMNLALGVDNELSPDTDEQTSVDLKLYLMQTQTVGEESELEVTFTLTGATFGGAVNWTDIRVDSDDDETNDSMDFEKVGGSQAGGDPDGKSVTLRVQVPDGNNNSITTDADGDTGYFIRLDLGTLEGYAGAGSVTVGATLRVTSGPDNNFPTGIEMRDAVAEVVDDPEDDSVTPADAIPGTSGMIATSVRAVTFEGADGDERGNIDLENRAKLAALATQVKVASIDHQIADPNAREANGKDKFAEGRGSAGDIHVTVSGMIRADDIVYFDSNPLNGMMDDKEELEINDGLAKGTFRLGDGAVYFMPDGETPMTAGSLSAIFAIEYDATSVVDHGDVMGGSKLVYNGVEVEARAYAIPAADNNNMDLANVRVTCGATGESKCTVFLDCNEQNSGLNHFGEVTEYSDSDIAVPLPAGATGVLRAAAIDNALGLDGAGWDGRLSCDVLSAEDVSVQVLVRSGGSLINNTYVDGVDR